MIEALPKLRSSADWYSILDRRPVLEPSDRLRPAEERRNLTGRLHSLFVPLFRYLDLAHCLEDSLRHGYWHRNPLKVGHFAEMYNRLPLLDSRPDPDVQAAAGFNIIGDPGLGKTQTVRDVLKSLPAAIRHSEYQGQMICVNQVVSAHIDCPSSGSLKDLADVFFRKIDEVIGTDYARLYAGRNTRVSLIGAMARVVINQQVGLLVVDEIEHLVKTRGTSADQMLNFLVQLRNVVGLPVILIGTPDADPLIRNKLRQGRRGTGGGGEHRWRRLYKDGAWDDFVRVLWDYQYTRYRTELDDSLSRVLYHHSQGIPDFAVKLFKFAQQRLITLGYDDKPLTPAFLDSVAVDKLGGCQTMLEGIRSGKASKLGAEPDVFVDADTSRADNRSLPPANPDNKDNWALKYAEWLHSAGFDGQTAVRLAADALGEFEKSVEKLALVQWAVNKQTAQDGQVPRRTEKGQAKRGPKRPKRKTMEKSKDAAAGRAAAAKRGVLRDPVAE